MYSPPTLSARRMSKPQCFTFIAILIAAALQSRTLRADEPHYTLTQSADETFIRISAIREEVAFDDLVHGLSAMGDLDSTGLARKIPDRGIDLSKKRTLVTLHLIEKALHGRAELGIERDDAGVAQALIIAVDRERVERDRQKSRRVSRKWLSAAGAISGHNIEELAWGVRGLDHVQLQPGQPLVVLIHGLQGSHDSLASLQRELTQAGHVCVTYAYPNDGPILDSAQRLARDLRSLEMPAESEFILVTHSMGGLVARRVVEDPDLDEPRIHRLIMIAPPSAGSNLAYLPASLDWHEHLKKRPVDSLPEFVFRSSSDGLNEAQHDLHPNSRFLLELNERPRNPRVQYSILLGTRSPATQAQLDAVSRQLDRLTEKSDTVQLFSPRLKKIFDHPLELTPGQGDGAVAIDRGRLAGVADVTLLPMDHWTATEDFSGDDGIQLAREVLNRLQ